MLLKLIFTGDNIGGTGSGGRVGHKLHGDVGEDQSQRQAALPGAPESGEESQREPPGGR